MTQNNSRIITSSILESFDLLITEKSSRFKRKAFFICEFTLATP
jgi:hypothetical protein